MNAAHSSWLVRGQIDRAAAGGSQGAQTVDFDISFENTRERVANLLLIRVGQTDFAKTRHLQPGAVVAWRVAAKSGSNFAIRGVRFADGNESDSVGA